MKKYITVNLDRAILWVLPPILRKQTHIVWLKTLLTPLKVLYEDTLYKMQHNGQIIYLEKVLNETFNPDTVYNPNYTTEEKEFHNLIYIDETLQPGLKFVHKHEEYYLHTPEEHFETPLYFLDSDGDSTGIVKLDEEGFLDPIELFTHHELVCKDPCYSNVNYPIYNTYLATTDDYTTVAYANFRILIPESLNIESSYFDANTDGVIDVLEKADLQKITNEIYFEKHHNAQKALAGAVEVRTPKFHQVVNFYKLAGKTYETYKYNTSESPEVSSTDECVCQPEPVVNN